MARLPTGDLSAIELALLIRPLTRCTQIISSTENMKKTSNAKPRSLIYRWRCAFIDEILDRSIINCLKMDVNELTCKCRKISLLRLDEPTQLDYGYVRIILHFWESLTFLFCFVCLSGSTNRTGKPTISQDQWSFPCECERVRLRLIDLIKQRQLTISGRDYLLTSSNVMYPLD